MTLTDFLLARLAEDESVARAAERRMASWTDKDIGPWVTARLTAEQIPGAVLDAHIARHDPARVLAEVAAKRAIVGWASDGEGEWHWSTVLAPLAAVYRDHPDFDPAWLD